MRGRLCAPKVQTFGVFKEGLDFAPFSGTNRGTTGDCPNRAQYYGQLSALGKGLSRHILAQLRYSTFPLSQPLFASLFGRRLGPIIPTPAKGDLKVNFEREVFKMKKTVKTSRVAGQLEKMYRLLNARFFNGELPEVVISLKKTVGAYGHFTCNKVWQAGDERRYEINISSATLSRPIEETCATLLHEMCHCLAAEKGIKDTSGSGNFYHNRKYKEIAESHGLCVEKHPKYGWTITSPGLPLLDFIEEQGWQDLQMCEAVSLWDVIGTLPKGTGNGTATKTKKPSSTRKYVCPCCHQSVRATKTVNILCGDCMKKMEPVE
jgi:hypothetical protein